MMFTDLKIQWILFYGEAYKYQNKRYAIQYPVEYRGVYCFVHNDHIFPYKSFWGKAFVVTKQSCQFVVVPNNPVYDKEKGGVAIFVTHV